MNSVYLVGVLIAVTTVGQGFSMDYYISPNGSDSNSGSIKSPFKSIAHAQSKARAAKAGEPTKIHLREGVYYLKAPLKFTAQDSGATYSAYKDEKVVLSGGLKLTLAWKPYRDGILQASTPAGPAIDQLFVNGKRLPMARYPNYDPNARPYNGAAADAFSPERAARWKDPTGGFIHAMHRAHWGGYHYRITGKNEKNEVTYEGGWQNNRPMGMHKKDRFVEGIFEELDAPGEWFHNAKTQTLYFYPPQGVDVNTATFEIARLPHLIEITGNQANPVKHITIAGIIFRHAARTFMETKEPLLRSDWTIYRGGAVLLTGAEDCAIVDCEFDQVGGNGVFVNSYNRRITVRGSHFHGIGASAVCFVGSPKSVRNPLFRYGQRLSYDQIDKTPGPQTPDYPADCLVDDCLIHDISVVEKQATGVEISMAKGITVRHCSIYKTGRAGINISEGTFGGHVIEFCDVFDTVRETGDHGSFNSWGRDRFWHLKGAPHDELPKLALLDVETNTIRNSRWRCDHGWDVDLDDGSSNYEIYNNLFLHGGLKLREGFHRKVYNNIAVNNTFHPHAWYDNSQDVVTNNIWMSSYRPAGRMPKGQWGKTVDRNLFTTEEDRVKFARHGCDANSLAGDPMFVDPENGDFRVKDGSPALKLGFKNFPMDQFGVQKPSLKKIARTPEIPELGVRKRTAATQPVAIRPVSWQGSTVRDLEGEEFSAFGVARDEAGVHLKYVPANSRLAVAGLQTGDLVQAVNGMKVRNTRDLEKAMAKAKGDPIPITYVRQQAERKTVLRVYAYTVAESSATANGFSKLPIAAASVPIRAIQSRPGTSNEPLATLHDGKLATNYGPVFANGVNGLYKVDLGRVVDIAAINTWSYSQNGYRGAQSFTLYGSTTEKDPGWDIANAKSFTPIGDVRSKATKKFLATQIRMASKKPTGLGRYRWLIWAPRAVTSNNENTAFQEIQIFAVR